jgi:hypothetical protein
MENVTITLSPGMCDLLVRGINALADSGELSETRLDAEAFDALTVVFGIMEDASRAGMFA